MTLLEAVLALLAACLIFAVLARRTKIPPAVMFVVGGMGLAFIPGMPSVTLDPELALALFLPPLLQASAFRTDLKAFKADIRAILLLAVGAVIFSAFCIGLLMHWLIPDLPFTVALAFGAIIAPPDAVAAASVLSRLPIPRRIVTVLEGESLLNDATALVLYRFSISAFMAGGFSFGEAAGSFLLVGAGGIAIGLAAARAAAWINRRVHDSSIEIALSFLVGFAVFMVAEKLHVSGVIAVVTLGIMMGRHRHAISTAHTRIEAGAVWSFVEFVLTSLVFILVGLQLNTILSRLSGWFVYELAGLALAVSLALVAVRFLWLFPAALLPPLIFPRFGVKSALPSAKPLIVVGWAGMRGVVSLAAALALPLDVPYRDLLIFLAFCAILATLVVQGTSLEWVIRRLGLARGRTSVARAEEADLRRVLARAQLEAVRKRTEDELDGVIAADLLPEYRDIDRVYHGFAGGASGAELQSRLQIRLHALREGRRAMLQHHEAHSLPDEMVLGMARELDLEEVRLLRLLDAASR
ncbi:Na+/H+ antiporter [Acetobacteraceae bacterium H6797]|nr:Na+/H+ antiporter [Acetobacteraceae bacterium H6797]